MGFVHFYNPNRCSWRAFEAFGGLLNAPGKLLEVSWRPLEGSWTLSGGDVGDLGGHSNAEGGMARRNAKAVRCKRAMVGKIRPRQPPARFRERHERGRSSTGRSNGAVVQCHYLGLMDFRSRKLGFRHFMGRCSICWHRRRV